jgi:hypothetical protein
MRAAWRRTGVPDGEPRPPRVERSTRRAPPRPDSSFYLPSSSSSHTSPLFCFSSLVGTAAGAPLSEFKLDFAGFWVLEKRGECAHVDLIGVCFGWGSAQAKVRNTFWALWSKEGILDRENILMKRMDCFL